MLKQQRKLQRGAGGPEEAGGPWERHSGVQEVSPDPQAPPSQTNLVSPTGAGKGARFPPEAASFQLLVSPQRRPDGQLWGRKERSRVFPAAACLSLQKTGARRSHSGSELLLRGRSPCRFPRGRERRGGQRRLVGRPAGRRPASSDWWERPLAANMNKPSAAPLSLAHSTWQPHTPRGKGCAQAGSGRTLPR